VDTEDVRLAVDGGFAREGRAPAVGALAAQLGASEGRLSRGCVRREPAQAAASFRAVGLSGPFWGL
jgi:hypothetical protein